MNIFVGNLSFNSSEHDVRALFEQHGGVSSVNLITDRDTGRPRGFGFVEMSNNDEARKAISALDGVDLDGRNLKVNEAKARESRPRNGGGGGRRDRW